MSLIDIKLKLLYLRTYARDKFVNEVVATSRNRGYLSAAQLWFRHFVHKDTTAFADYAGGSNLTFLSETVILLFVIFDGERCCIDNLNNKVVIYQRRLLSFIESDDYAHF